LKEKDKHHARTKRLYTNRTFGGHCHYRPVIGDIDGDGRVNSDDIAMLVLMTFAASTKADAVRDVHAIYGATPDVSFPNAFYVNGDVGIGTQTPNEKLHVFWDTNVDAELGRGTGDPDITFLSLRNANGTKIYIYPDAAGTGLVVTTTHP